MWEQLSLFFIQMLRNDELIEGKMFHKIKQSGKIFVGCKFNFCTLASQQEGPGFDSRPRLFACPLCVCLQVIWLLPTVQRHASGVNRSFYMTHRCEWECVSLCWPCDELPTCLG